MRHRFPLQRTFQLVLAILVAAIAAAVYRSFVVSELVPIGVEVVAAELPSSDHTIKVALPDLSALSGHSAVLAVRLRNAGDQAKHVGLSLHGLPDHRIELPPHRTVRRNIGLSPGIVRGLAVDAGSAGRRSLQLTADGDAWFLTALEIRNYQLRLGERLAVIVPGRGDMYSSAPGFAAAAIVLALLAVAQALTPRAHSRPLRLIGIGVALAAFLVCVSCVLLPTISNYTVLLSPPAFALIAAGLFAPVLLHAARPAYVWTRSFVARAAGAVSRHRGTVTRYWGRHAVTFERGAALLALVAIGVAQPIFEVVSNSPEFFAARSTSPTTAIAAALVICLGVPLALLGIERTLRAATPRAAAALYAAVLALLSAAVVMPWFRRSEALTSPWDAAISGLIGVGVALAHARIGLVRQFLTALAPAALAVPAVFLLNPAVARTFLPSESAAGVQEIERTPPIVLVVFDELPLNSLLGPDGTIDAVRYRNFAALARDAYWFRNASTVSSETVWAVPAILSGRYPTTRRAVPTLRYYPVNLFTTLAPHYDIFASMRFQRLCPPRACEYNSAIPPDTVWSLLSDLGLVWLHIVLPQPLTEALPPVVGDWVDFGGRRAEWKTDARTGRAAVFAEFLSSIDGRPGRLHVMHSMLPHMLFQYVPSGRQYAAPDYQMTIERGKGLFERASAAYADTLHQRHLAQVGFVDRLVGDLIARLRDVGAYDQALVIVTADHGASYREGQARRGPREHNVSDIIQVPLFIKVPGQQRGAALDRIVETVDILPTILDVLGAKVLLRLDGRSLIDSRVPERSFRTFFRDDANVALRVLTDSAADRALSLDRKLRRFGSGDPMALYAPAEARHWLGRKVTETGIRRAADVQITLRNRRDFAAVQRDRDPLPLYVRGVLSTSRPDPLTVAVVVNGSVAAVAESYRERGAHVFGTLIPETSLRDGSNTVEAFVVDAVSPNDPRLSSALRGRK